MRIDRHVLGAGIRLAGRPPISVAGRVMTPELWAEVIDRATPGERPAILKRLEPWLRVATEAGRNNTRRWLDAGHPVPPPDALPLITGDTGAVPLVTRAMAMSPAPVRWHVLEHVGFSAVGFECMAWTTAPMRSRPIEVRLSGAVDLRVVLHEIAHAWHRPPIAKDPPGAVEWFAALAIAKRDRGDALDQYQDGELLADALAAAWGAA